MTKLLFVSTGIFGVMLSAASSYAQFVPDEFNSTTMGTQWTWHDSTPTGSTHSFNGSHFEIKAIEGADMFFTVDNYAYLEQDAPAGTNWEVVTKLEGFDPTAEGFRNEWNKCGLMLWQDNDHWFSVWLMGNDGIDGGEGWNRRVEGAYDCWTEARAGNHLGEYAEDNAYFSFTSDPVWLKIQKTEHGYFGLFSTDGTNWTQVNCMVRNSGNPTDGYFSPEKIRLLQSGPGSSGTNATGSFDFIQSNPVTVPTATAGTDDEFNGTSLDTSIWGVYEGFHASAMEVADGKLKITPANWNDQWGGVDQSVRVYQDAPATGDWQVTVKAGPTEMHLYQDWSGYGLMVWQDQNDWVLVGNVQAGGSGNHMIQTAYQRDDAYAWNNHDTDIIEDPLPEYLRITKIGTVYTGYYSHDGVNFSAQPEGGHDYLTELQNPQVHLIAKKVNAQGGPQLVTEFDWVHFETLGSSVNDWQIY